MYGCQSSVTQVTRCVLVTGFIMGRGEIQKIQNGRWILHTTNNVCISGYRITWRSRTCSCVREAISRVPIMRSAQQQDQQKMHDGVPLSQEGGRPTLDRVAWPSSAERGCTVLYPPFASAVNIYHVLTLAAVLPPTAGDAPTRAVEAEGISTISTKLRAAMGHAVVAAEQCIPYPVVTLTDEEKGAHRIGPPILNFPQSRVQHRKLWTKCSGAERLRVTQVQSW